VNHESHLQMFKLGIPNLRHMEEWFDYWKCLSNIMWQRTEICVNVDQAHL
jgi:hypothetical protein